MAEDALAVQEYASWQAMKQIPPKRKAPVSDTEPSLQSKKKKISGSPQTKNAVQALNEYKPGMSRLLAGVVCITRNSGRSGVRCPQSERAQSRPPLPDRRHSAGDSVRGDGRVS